MRAGLAWQRLGPHLQRRSRPGHRAYPIAPAPPIRTPQGLDAVIDISAHTTVADFRLVRASNILTIIHKAGTERRSQVEAARLAFFLDCSRPDPRALLALDLEPNEGDPSNSMTREQAEALVQAVASATGRLPLIYAHPTWANGGAGITPSILARCGLWVVD